MGKKECYGEDKCIKMENDFDSLVINVILRFQQ